MLRYSMKGREISELYANLNSYQDQPFFLGLDLERMHYVEHRTLSTDARRIEQSQASYEQPQKIGHYSQTSSKYGGTVDIKDDESNLCYLHLPLDYKNNDSLGFDLKEGFDKFSDIDWSLTGTTKLDEFLKWILKYGHSLLSDQNKHSDKFLDIDFVTYRGILTKIMVTPFVRDKWYIGATKFNGTIYLCQFDDADELDDGREFKQMNLFSYGGRRFEHYVTRPSPDAVDQEPFSAIIYEYAAVIKSKLKTAANEKISLLYAAEMDGLAVGKTDSSKLENFVEIKTTRRVTNENQNRSLMRFKLIKWWAQCYLAGIGQIVCGYKEDDNVINQIEMMNVRNIPYRCGQFWNRHDCLNFLHQFLAHVQSLLADVDDPEKVYMFTNCQRPYTITCRELSTAGNFIILPKWYCQEFNSKKTLRTLNSGTNG